MVGGRKKELWNGKLFIRGINKEKTKERTRSVQA
jgi:hypothetical protein